MRKALYRDMLLEKTSIFYALDRSFSFIMILLPSNSLTRCRLKFHKGGLSYSFRYLNIFFYTSALSLLLRENMFKDKHRKLDS